MRKCYLIFVMIILSVNSLCFGKELDVILKDFESYAEKAFKEWQAVGMSIAIVKDGKIVFTKGFGQRSLKDSEPVTADTIFQIGSISKSFTTTLSAIAVDKGLFKWEDAVLDHLSDFFLYDPWVTRQFQIEDLFAQRSGLPPYSGDVQAMLGTPIEKMIDNIRFFKPISSFRSKFAYLNIFFSIGAKLLEKKTGKCWGSLLQKELFDPLDMHDSSYTLEAYMSKRNRAGLHLRKPGGKIIQIPDDFDAADWIYIYSASGGINSSAKEMANWVILQSDHGVFKGKKIISKENLARTTRPQIYAGERYGGDNFYCLGWISLDYSPYPIIWHNGGTSGVNNNLAFISEERLGIVILCNTRETLLAEALTMQFFDLFFEKKDRDWSKKLLEEQNEKDKLILAKKTSVKNPLPALPLQNYAGIYSNEVYGDAHVIVDGDNLKIKIGPKSTIWTLKHYNRDSFTLWWAPEEGETKVFFYFDADSKPSKMIIEMLQGDGQGTFIKKE